MEKRKNTKKTNFVKNHRKQQLMFIVSTIFIGATGYIYIEHTNNYMSDSGSLLLKSKYRSIFQHTEDTNRKMDFNQTRILKNSKNLKQRYMLNNIYAEQKLALNDTQVDNIPLKKDMKKILIWNKGCCPYGGSEGAYGSTPFKSCEFSNCYMTGSQIEFPMEDADAIIYRHKGEQSSFPNIIHNSKTKLIFQYREAPAHYKELRSAFRHNNQFHWAMSIRTDLDIDFRLNTVFKRRKRDVSYLSNNFHSGKTTMAAWMVSNCRNDPSHRMRLVNTIRKYITVDIYGRCGSKSCPKSKKEMCYKKMGLNYFFYLSFENSLCKDYMTEKVFDILRHRIIPVVYGLGPYKQYLPEKSYIDVFDFKSIAELTKYMMFLAENPEEYNKYFWWKADYFVPPMDRVPGIGCHWTSMCNLCKKINLDGHKPAKYIDLKESIHMSAHCVSVKDPIVNNFINGVTLAEPYNSFLYATLFENVSVDAFRLHPCSDKDAILFND